MKTLSVLLLLPFVFSTLPARVAGDAKEVSAVKAGSEAPNPTLTNLEGEAVTLEALRGDQPTVLVFYRGGWCPYCTRQLADLQKVMPELENKGWQLIAVSPDSTGSIQAMLKKQKVDYTLVSDAGMKAAKAFGIAFQLQEPMLKKLKSYKIDVVEASGEDHRQLPVPSVFLIDGKGEITFAHSNPDYKVRLSPDELLEAAGEK